MLRFLGLVAAAAAAVVVVVAAASQEPHEEYADPEDLRDRVHEFLDHLRARYSQDPRAARALEAFKEVRVDTAMPGVMSFSRTTGVLKVNPDRVRDDPAHAVATLLHELAHTTPERHNAEWRDTFLFFAEVATRDLGWGVRLACPHCKFYGVCSQDQCPRCTFDACPPGSSVWALKDCKSRRAC